MSIEGLRATLPPHLAKLELVEMKNKHTPDYKLGTIIKSWDGRSGLVVEINHNRRTVTLAIVS